MGRVVDECLHGLTAAWCATCKEKTRGERKRERQWDAVIADAEDDHTIRAKYEGWCVCGTKIEVGDPIAYRERAGWCCVECGG